MNYLPIDNKSPNFSIDVAIDDFVYEFKFVYNTFAERWALSMRRKSGNWIFQGLFVVLGFDYFSAVTNEALPDRQLFAVNLSGSDEPNYENFGDSVKMVII